MIPIETSKDLLFVVLAICIFWLTFFLIWLLYRIIVIVRDAGSFVHQARSAAERVDQLAKTVKEKFEHSAASLALIAQALKEVVVWVIEERREKKAGGAKKKKSDEEEE